MKGFRKKITGECLIVSSYIKSVRETKNTKREVIIKHTLKAVVLECGHKVKISQMSYFPKKAWIVGDVGLNQKKNKALNKELQ